MIDEKRIQLVGDLLMSMSDYEKLTPQEVKMYHVAFCFGMRAQKDEQLDFQKGCDEKQEGLLLVERLQKSKYGLDKASMREKLEYVGFWKLGFLSKLKFVFGV